jgi:hypothetical protein
MSGVFKHLEQGLVRVTRLRDELLANPGASNREARLVAVFECKAWVWSQFYELSSQRLVWRAAPAAKVRTRANAALWAQRAALMITRASVVAIQEEAADRGGAPRPAFHVTAVSEA